jgi:hypothetical protein
MGRTPFRHLAEPARRGQTAVPSLPNGKLDLFALDILSFLSVLFRRLEEAVHFV